MKERILVISTDVKKTEEETETSPEGQKWNNFLETAEFSKVFYLKIVWIK